MKTADWMKNKQRTNRAKPILFGLAQAAKLAGISEALLILWIDTERFVPSMEDKSQRAKDFWGWSRFTFDENDIKRLRKMVDTEGSAHVKGSDYTVQELAALWNMSEDKIRELFADETGVKKIPSKNKKRNKRSSYITLRIPESVADRVQRKLS